MLFGVRVVLDPMRKSVSLNNLSEYEQTEEIPKIIIAEDEKNKTSSGYASADDAVPISSSRERKRGTVLDLDVTKHAFVKEKKNYID